MAKGRAKQQAESKHSEVYEVYEEMEPARPVTVRRSSKFKEGTMNSTMSIHAPPDELWKGLDIENMIKGFNEENSAPVSATGVVPATPTVAPASEGAFGRIWRPISSFFNGAGASFSALGKRKAGSENAEAKAIDKPSYDSKADVEAAYHRAKEQGLLPTPKVFIRPVSRAPKTASTPTPETPAPAPSSLAPPKTPALYKSPSKKDLHKQKKLSKRVSELELKLASARKELSIVLASPRAPPVPPIPANLPSPPPSNHFFSENETSPHNHAGLPSNLNSSSKIVKKRKAADDDEEFKPVTTDSEISQDSERESKRSKSTPSKKLKRKSSSRLMKKRSTVTKEEVVIMVPDGLNVPPIPSIPKGIEGKKVARKIKRFFGIGKYEATKALLIRFAA